MLIVPPIVVPDKDVGVLIVPPIVVADIVVFNGSGIVVVIGGEVGVGKILNVHSLLSGILLHIILNNLFLFSSFRLNILLNLAIIPLSLFLYCFIILNI